MQLGLCIQEFFPTPGKSVYRTPCEGMGVTGEVEKNPTQSVRVKSLDVIRIQRLVSSIILLRGTDVISLLIYVSSDHSHSAPVTHAKADMRPLRRP